MKSVKYEARRYCGIDVSGDTLHVCYQADNGILEWIKCTNNAEGFTHIWKHTGKDYHFVMESTGVYQLPFCFFLESKKSRYSVVNALQIKRYMQMKLEHNKSGKKDAFHICMYEVDHNPECYEIPDRLYFEAGPLTTQLKRSLQKSQTSKTNYMLLQSLI